MKGAGKVRKSPCDWGCAYCQKPIYLNEDFVYWHRKEHTKVEVVPVHVECYEKVRK